MMATSCRAGVAPLFLAVLLSGLAAPALGSTVRASTTTLLSGRPDVRYGEVHTAVPVVELLRLSGDGFDVPAVDDVRVRVSGWGRLYAAETSQLAGDLEMGFLQGRLLNKRLGLTLGRHFVSGGAARVTQVDGASADVAIARGIGLAAYGGVPVVPRFAVARGDALYGGRAYWRKSLNTEVGLSFLELRDHGLVARRDAGLDARFQARKELILSGYGLWGLAEMRLAELDVGPTWTPFSGVQVSAQYRRTAPDLFLQRSSIFSVFADTQRDEVGGGVLWQASRHVGLLGEYHSVWIGEGRGDDPLGRVNFRSDSSGTTTASVQIRWLRIPVNGYVQARIAAARKLTPKVTLALDFDAYQFSQPINGASTSMSTALTASYSIAPKWLVALSGTAGVTPLLESRFEAIAKLVYNFSTTMDGKSP